MTEETETDTPEKIVYHSVLSELDKLPIDKQLHVALYWVKYVMAAKCDPGSGRIRMGDLMEATADFANLVLDIPYLVYPDMRNEPPCGVCPACIANRTKARSIQ